MGIRKMALGSIALIGILLMCISSASCGGSSRVDRQTLDAASHICKNWQIIMAANLGMMIEPAPAYSGGPSPHPVVLLDSSCNEHPWLAKIPNEWLPETVTATELVACLSREEETAIQTCRYTGPPVTRYRYSLDITLRDVKTGQTVAVTTLNGSSPRACGQRERYSLTRLEGSHVSYDQVQEWLEEYVVQGKESITPKEGRQHIDPYRPLVF